jgi:hypothetical protein
VRTIPVAAGMRHIQMLPALIARALGNHVRAVMFTALSHGA